MAYRNKILVPEVPVGIDNDMIDLIFSNPTKYGKNIEIVNIQKREVNGRFNHFIIEFEEEEHANRVIQEGGFDFENVKYNPKFYDEREFLDSENNDDSAVLIENIKDDIDTIILYFESPRTCNGGPIKSHQYDENNKELTIVYSDSKTAKNVVQFGRVKINNNFYQAKSLKTEKNKVMIENVSEHMINTARLLFENERKSGGGKIINHEYINNTLIITYENDDIAQRVIEFGEITFQNKKYKAAQFKRIKKIDNFHGPDKVTEASKIENNKFKLLVDANNDQNNMTTFDNETLKIYIRYLLNHDQFTFPELDYGIKGLNDDNMQYLVLSDQVFDFNIILEKHKKMPILSQKPVKLEQLNQTACIIVQTKLLEDHVQLHFLIEGSSGGGDINCFKAMDNTYNDLKIYLIEFKDADCVDRILKKTQPKEMQIQPLFEDIKLFEAKLALKLKEKMKNKHVEKEKPLIHKLNSSEFPFTFALKREYYVEKLRSILSKYDAKIINNTNLKDNEWDIEYLESKLSGEQLKICLDNFKNKFGSKDWSVDSDVLPIVKPKLERFYCNSSNINLSFIDKDEKNHVIRIEGDNDIISCEINKIDLIINDDKNKKISDEVKNLESYKCSLLIKDNFIANLKQNGNDIVVKIIPPKGIVVFEGLIHSILVAKQKMWDILNALKNDSFKISYFIGKFLMDCRDYVEKCLEDLKINCEYEITFENEKIDDTRNELCTVILHAINQDGMNKTRKYIKDNITEFKYELEPESEELLNGLYPQFLLKMKDELKETNEENHVIFETFKENKSVWCIGEKGLVSKLSVRIKNLFESNTIYKKYVDKYKNDELRYLSIVKRMDIEELKDKYSFKLNFEEISSNVLKLKITSNKIVFEQLIKDLDDLLENMLTDHYTDNSNLREFFFSEKGRRSLKLVELESYCLIDNVSENEVDYHGNSDLDSENNKIRESKLYDENTFVDCYEEFEYVDRKKSDSKITKHSKVEYKIGSILDVVNSVDVIVNTTSPNLDLNSGRVSELIFKKAGASIQDELNENYPNGLNNTCLVAISRAGNLAKQNMKNIFHIALERYHDGRDIENTFKETIKQLLKEADKKQFTSIAMPAFGTGVLGYPKDKVAAWMLATIHEYFQISTRSPINKVFIVLFDQDLETIKEFEKYENHEQNDTETVSTANDKFYSDLNGDQSKGYSMKFQDVKIHVFIGEITKSKEDVIINPTTNELNLTGNVTKALLTAAGQSLRNELKNNNLNRDGLLFTNCGNLHAKKILHVAINATEIQKCVINALNYINSEKYKSVIFPVIGTGNLNTDERQAVKSILEGFTEFITQTANKQINLNEIKICIYVKQPHLLNMFYDEMKELADKKSAKSNKNIVSRFFDYLKGDKKSDIAANNDRNDFIEIKKRSTSTFDLTKGIGNTQRKIKLLKLISDQTANIKKAKEKIEITIKNEQTYTHLPHSHIKNLTSLEKQEIENICGGNSVECDFKNNEIKLVGISSCLPNCIAQVNHYLNKRMERTIHEAHETAKEVQWEYCDNGKWKPYTFYLNSTIEEAHKNKTTNFEFQDNNNEDCYIDFGTNTQHDKVSKKKMYAVRRIDLTKNRLDITIPTTWAPNKSCNLIALSPKAQEYKDVIKTLDDNKFASTKIKNIVSIERVQNTRLYVQYQAHKLHFKERDANSVNERVLFHGTNGEAVASIWQLGFNRSYCGKNATLYGKGVYFAREPSFSHRYTNLGDIAGSKASGNTRHAHMFVCKVLVGYYAVGDEFTENKNLPKAPNGKLVDSTVDEVDDKDDKKPSIFVIYHDAQAYPEYLVTYE